MSTIWNRRRYSKVEVVPRPHLLDSSLPMGVDLNLPTGFLGVPGPSLGVVPTLVILLGVDPVMGHLGTPTLVESFRGDSVTDHFGTPSPDKGYGVLISRG